MNRVQNKIALVTGGARGIGLAIATLLSKEGAIVIIVDVLEEEGAQASLSIGGKFYPLDVSKEASWQQLSTQITNAYGRLDILVNNAGITGLNEALGPQDPENITLDAWHYVHQINLDSVFLGCKYGMKLMQSKGGSIINISSRSGIVGIPGACAYASSKAAIRNHTKSVALYCASKRYPIRCNSIHPGAILTPMWDSMLPTNSNDRAQAIHAIAAEVPLGVMGKPLDVAYAALYLASDESNYVTGIELTIDGGILAGSNASPKQYEDV